MPAESGNPDPIGNPSDSSSRRSRTCQVLFVLGSGFDPSEQAESLASEFRGEHASLKFSKAETVIQAADEWQSGDKSGFRKSVATVVKNWCRDQAASFDPKRLLVSDYQDDEGRLFAVAGYFPRRKSKSGKSPSDTDIPREDSAAADTDDDENGEVAKPSKLVVLAQEWIETAKAQPPKRLAMVGGGVVALLILAVVVPMLFSDNGGSDIAQPDPDETTQAPATNAAATTPKLSPPIFTTTAVRTSLNLIRMRPLKHRLLTLPQPPRSCLHRFLRQRRFGHRST